MARSRITADDVDFLSLLTDVNRQRLVETSQRAVFTAGTRAFAPEAPPYAFLVEKGLARGYCSVPDGRQATVVFIHANELVGGTAIVSHAPRVYLQAVVDSTFTILDLETVRKLAATEIDVVSAIATHLAARIRNAFRLIAVRSLGNIRERVAYDLLERACQRQLAEGRLEAKVTQGELADSIGSSREVVSRSLRNLRVERVVETEPGVIRVVDAIRLAAIVRAFVI